MFVYAFMLWRVFVACVSISLVCVVCAVRLYSCLFCFWCVCFVCGALCCCLLFHWFVVRVYVVVVLLTCVFCYGLNAFPVPDCMCVCPVFALLFSFCVMLFVCLCVFVMACFRCLFIDFIGLFCAPFCYVLVCVLFLVCVFRWWCVVLLCVV